MINETLAKNLTPQGAERLLMIQMLTAKQQPQPVQPEPALKPKSSFPHLGEEVFVKKTYLGSPINRKLIFTGIVANMIESKWVMCGIFFSEEDGGYTYATKEDIEP